MNHIYKVLEILVGDKVAIRRGFTSGFVAGIPVTLLIYFYTDYFDDPTSVLFLMVILGALIVGEAIGWGFTRPLAAMLSKNNPDRNLILWELYFRPFWLAFLALVVDLQ